MSHSLFQQSLLIKKSFHKLSQIRNTNRRKFVTVRGDWETVVGLEIHTQLALSQKLFSSQKTLTNSSPNTQVSVLDAAFPGALPRLNENSLVCATKAALILSSSINSRSYFERKHYFYGDLPAGYQITQRSKPFSKGGVLHLKKEDGFQQNKSIRISQIQIEQDSGKSTLGSSEKERFIDLNRAGVGVLEIVCEPDIRVKDHQMKQIIVLNPKKGSWRCDINVSVRKAGEKFGVRTEIKHLVKYSSIKEAIDYESDRLCRILENGGEIQQETRGYDISKKETFHLRSKEESEDYRFNEFVESVQKSLPESIEIRKKRLTSQYGLSSYQIEILIESPGSVEYFEKSSMKFTEIQVIGEVFGWLKMRNLSLNNCPVEPESLGELLDMIEKNEISGLMAKNVLHAMMDGESQNPRDIASKYGWIQLNDEKALIHICEEVCHSNPDTVLKIKQGKERLIGFLIGEVMIKTGRKSNPHVVNTIFRNIFGLSEKEKK
ncbi:hypothetical protein HK096_010833 [Nowakowskiella sp. JEL0078]|nr:hypothetical protein HK096_010833 [Nowakowskiella sp. JEL0078]